MLNSVLRYLIVYLNDSAPSYCHFNNNNGGNNLIKIDELKEGLLWALKENLRIQVVYPKSEIPFEYEALINSVDHIKIKPMLADGSADIFIIDSWSTLQNYGGNKDGIYVIRTTLSDFNSNQSLLRDLMSVSKRVNVIFSDLASISEEEISKYKDTLESLANYIAEEWPCSLINLLTDRMMLSKMNNCGAGEESITLMPDGYFYICAGEYYDAIAFSHQIKKELRQGTPKSGVEIKNARLYKIEYAPLCRTCDAYNCQRCVYLNKKRTREVNTPSHMQCVLSHISRNASSYLQKLLSAKGISIGADIPEISYLDPIEVHPRYRMV